MVAITTRNCVTRTQPVIVLHRPFLAICKLRAAPISKSPVVTGKLNFVCSGLI